jgi:hypothetical protein
MYINAIIVGGIMTFFLLEKLTQAYLGGGHSHSHHTHDNAVSQKASDKKLIKP